MNAGNDSNPATSVASPDAADRSPPTVLCIDDDPNISEAIARRLRRHGIQVLRAFHGMQGYWQAVVEKPDLIVLDLVMPKGEGTEVLEVLKRNSETADIPVIILSGKIHPSLSRRLEKLGAVRCFAKPTPLDELLAEISRHVPVPA